MSEFSTSESALARFFEAAFGFALAFPLAFGAALVFVIPPTADFAADFFATAFFYKKCEFQQAEQE